MSRVMKTIDVLLEESGLTMEEVVSRTGLAAERVDAIYTGRWLPSPDERRRLAAALEIMIEDVSWGHSMPPRNVRYQRFGLKENF